MTDIKEDRLIIYIKNVEGVPKGDLLGWADPYIKLWVTDEKGEVKGFYSFFFSSMSSHIHT